MCFLFGLSQSFCYTVFFEADIAGRYCLYLHVCRQYRYLELLCSAKFVKKALVTTGGPCFFFLTFFFYFSFLSQNTSTNIHNFILFSVPRKYAGTGDARCPAVVSGHGTARPGEYAGGPGQPPWCSVSRQCSAPRYALGPGRAQRNAHERWPAETYDEVMSVCRIQRIRFILLDPAKTI